VQFVAIQYILRHAIWNMYQEYWIVTSNQSGWHVPLFAIKTVNQLKHSIGLRCLFDVGSCVFPGTIFPAWCINKHGVWLYVLAPWICVSFCVFAFGILPQYVRIAVFIVPMRAWSYLDTISSETSGRRLQKSANYFYSLCSKGLGSRVKSCGELCERKAAWKNNVK
jgi:hypothetical protein